ncbi:MAG: hypothetical protein HYW09_00225 [Candidatus Niyogibacteria bacterium]|nr:hypothetical protein [Candidatus Niyogibacteria bacterium]
MKGLRPLRVVLLLFLLTLVFGAVKLVRSENDPVPDNVAIVSVESYDLFAGGRQVWAQVGGLVVRRGRPTVVTPAHALIYGDRFVSVRIGKDLFYISKSSIEIFLDRDLAFIPLPENYPVISAFKVGNQDSKVGELFAVGFVRSGDFSRDQEVFSGRIGIKLKFAKGKMSFLNRGTLCELTKNLTLCAKYGAISGLYDSAGNIRFQDRPLFAEWLKEEPGILSGRMEAYKPEDGSVQTGFRNALCQRLSDCR